MKPLDKVKALKKATERAMDEVRKIQAKCSHKVPTEGSREERQHCSKCGKQVLHFAVSIDCPFG